MADNAMTDHDMIVAIFESQQRTEALVRETVSKIEPMIEQAQDIIEDVQDNGISSILRSVMLGR